MNLTYTSFSFFSLHFFAFLLLLVPSLSLNTDGALLLSFRYSILSDPLSVFDSWNYDDATPCSWTGVTCSHFTDPPTPDPFRVTALVLSNSKLLGSISKELGYIEHLRHLDLSGNLFNGTLPDSIFNSTQLQVISLAGNMISGELPESVGQMKSLKVLNLSDNAFDGNVPDTLPQLNNLTVVSLRSNYLSGDIPSRFDSVEVLDLSSNLFNGTLPLDFGGGNLRYLNLSYNKISGSIPPVFAKRLSADSTIDLSFNNLTGAIPESLALINQKTDHFSGNGDLCGKPLKVLCSIPSTLSTPPNISTAISPAIAVLPRTVDANPEINTPGGTGNVQNHGGGNMRPGTLAAIAVTNLAGLAILGMVILYVYQLKKRKKLESQFAAAAKSQKKPDAAITKFQFEAEKSPPVSSCSCLTSKQEQNLETTSSDSDREENNHAVNHSSNENYKKRGQLVTVVGETELELETLLKASAYILGTSGSSIVYKAVLEDGTALAVRRIGESCVERLKDFEAQVRGIAKLRHPNLVKVRGFYWGEDEKLLISDYVSNGSLAFSGYRSRPGSSPCHLPLEVRLKIAKGVARGLAFIHEKKQAHGNIKPSNILLNAEMEPIITDLGLHRLVSGKTVFKPNNSARFLSSHYPTPSRDTTPHDHIDMSSPYAPTTSSSTETASPYQAPESLKNLKPNSKWDVYSFGVILLELLSGRAFSEGELNQWLESGSVDEEMNRVLRFVEGAIRRDVEGREDVFVGCFRLGLRCASFMPQKRPSMREALQILEKITTNILWV